MSQLIPFRKGTPSTVTSPVTSQNPLPVSPPTLSSPVSSSATFAIGSLVSAQYSADGKYYPATIMDISGNQYLVKYTQYNEQEWRPQTVIRPQK